MLPGGRPQAPGSIVAALVGDLSLTSQPGGDVRGRTERRCNWGDCALGASTMCGRTTATLEALRATLVRWATGGRVGCARPSDQRERGATHPGVRAAWWPDAPARRRQATLCGERLGGGRCAHTRSPAGVSKSWVASRPCCVSDLTRTS